MIALNAVARCTMRVKNKLLVESYEKSKKTLKISR
jgi:hypothetical protein